MSYGFNHPEGKIISLEREVVDYYHHMKSKQEEQESQEGQEKEIVKNTHFNCFLNLDAFESIPQQT